MLRLEQRLIMFFHGLSLLALWPFCTSSHSSNFPRRLLLLILNVVLCYHDCILLDTLGFGTIHECAKSFATCFKSCPDSQQNTENTRQTE
mmetsp:Transcript_26520/g.53068  ORF Transcript_26520/g.53068 Transcript_26520/m.53068 type:complete len:90 (+) Transcript_26520:116-385(+)